VRRFYASLIVLMLAAASLIGCQPATQSPTSAQPTGSTAVSNPAATAAKTQEGGPVPKQYSAPPAMTVDQNKKYVATIHTTDGDMKADLFVKDAPITVNNFAFLARDSYYNDVKFHRIIKGFMVQTGDPTGTGRGSPGYRFNDEKVTREYVRGTLAMDNAGQNTNGSQFFIIDQGYALPKNYTIFGQVTGEDSLAVLDKIASTPVTASPSGERSQPTQDVRITGIEIAEQ
jgi:cyclophilin family peptidyl-prolyl cis-trans isomerase